jgi:biopolymer transport protein ExbB
MKFLTKYMLAGILLLHIPNFSIAQEAVEKDTPSNAQQLLSLVKEGQVSEQNENARREAEFLANKNEQAAILAAEKRELANQERIADQLEAEYKKNEEILRVKEEAYMKELGSLVELFGHLHK